MEEFIQFIVEGREQEFVAFERHQKANAVVGCRANGQVIGIDAHDLVKAMDLNSPAFKSLFEKALSENNAIQHGWYQKVFGI